MKRLSKKATNTFRQMHLLTQDNYLKLDNSQGTFMPLSFEILGQSADLQGVRFDIVSMAHYFVVQNGDLMSDPEMTFLYAEINGEHIVIPGSYRLDGLGINQESVRYTKKEGWRFNKALQMEHTRFAEMWLKNIKSQQKLDEQLAQN